MFITKQSLMTGVEHTMDINVTEEQLLKWANGGVGSCIQTVMPNLTASEREFLINGVTPDEWDGLVKDPIEA
jgi:hypothetical protein